MNLGMDWCIHQQKLNAKNRWKSVTWHLKVNNVRNLWLCSHTFNIYNPLYHYMCDYYFFSKMKSQIFCNPLNFIFIWWFQLILNFWRKVNKCSKNALEEIFFFFFWTNGRPIALKGNQKKNGQANSKRLHKHTFFETIPSTNWENN